MKILEKGIWVEKTRKTNDIDEPIEGFIVSAEIEFLIETLKEEDAEKVKDEMQKALQEVINKYK
jgi:hypothetical protein